MTVLEQSRFQLGMEPETVSRRKEMLELSSLVAKDLLKQPLVTRVGIGGSLAKGKEHPNDIDFWIFFKKSPPNQQAIEHSETLNHNTEETITWDIHYISNKPSIEEIARQIQNCSDPSFFEREISQVVLIYNPHTNQFEKTKIFPRKTMKIIHQVTFETLKLLASHLEGVIRSHLQ